MHEIHIEGRDRPSVYEELLPQIEALLTGETNAIANLANAAAALKQALGFFWVGFYLVHGDELILGPFQGPVACTRIPRNQGVCGKAWEENTSILVPDVDRFPGHIACSSLARSELVVPLRDSHGKVIGVLDVDSDRINDFSETDRDALEKVAALASNAMINP